MADASESILRVPVQLARRFTGLSVDFGKSSIQYRDGVVFIKWLLKLNVSKCKTRDTCSGTSPQCGLGPARHARQARRCDVT